MLANGVMAIPELVLDGETGLLVDEYDLATFETQLRRLLADKPLRRRLGDAGRKRIIENYTVELQARNAIAIL